jgi:hypothetical protein
MILTAILNLFYAAVATIASFFTGLADVSLATPVASAITAAAGYYASLNAYLPLDTAITIVAFDLVFETSYFIYKMIRWAYQKIPMIN